MLDVVNPAENKCTSISHAPLVLRVVRVGRCGKEGERGDYSFRELPIVEILEGVNLLFSM